VLLSFAGVANPIELLRTSIEAEQRRIDSLDGKLDQYIRLSSPEQSEKLSRLYFDFYHYAAMFSAYSGDEEWLKLRRLELLYKRLNRIKGINDVAFNADERWGDLLRSCLKEKDNTRLERVLISDPVISLQLMPFYSHRTVFKSVLMQLMHTHPKAVLNAYANYGEWTDNELLEKAIRIAPMKVKTYLSSRNKIRDQYAGMSHDRHSEFNDLYRRFGTVSNGYTLLDLVRTKEKTIDQVHYIPFDSAMYFQELMKLSFRSDPLSEHSLEEALKQCGLKVVRVLNDLHNEPDAIRYRPIQSCSAEELYTLLVYTEDEIFTSTFLYIYPRLIEELEDGGWTFLNSINLNRFRTFIKMCAGYGKLEAWLQTMNSDDQEKLLKAMCSNLQIGGQLLEEAAAVITTYESLPNEPLRASFRNYTDLSHQNALRSGSDGLVYEVLLDIMKNGVGDGITSIKHQSLFHDGEHIQQHFFYDDDDGIRSFAAFLSYFNSPGWDIEDRGKYVLIKSTTTHSVLIYANKPKYEKLGQEAITTVFRTTNRWPEVVIHRGHSYYADIAINSITPNAQIVFLGSCGGYNNINSVLERSADAHIISSKQIGTLKVNNEVTLRMCNLLANGEGISWPDLWVSLSNEFQNDPFAMERFREYIPPHQNLGAHFIKAYKRKCRI
jgi:hypothetical protein